MNNTNTDIFLNKYRQLEDAIRNTYGDELYDKSPIIFLENHPEYRSCKNELDYCREIRNLLTHSPKVNGNYIVQPSDDMIKLLENTIQKVNHPPRAHQIMVPSARILCKTMYDLVLPAMIEMNKKTYTHIPILENNVVVGVFSENTLLSYVINDENIDIDMKMKFSDIAKYLPVESHKAESFRFVSSNAFVSDIKAAFEEALCKTDRIGMIFVTQNGKETEKLLGIITAWDVAGRG